MDDCFKNNLLKNSGGSPSGTIFPWLLITVSITIIKLNSNPEDVHILIPQY